MRAVVGVWAVSGALNLARELLPLTLGCVEGPSVAIAATDAGVISGTSARIGESPTASRMSIAPDGLLLMRGPSWTAPIYYRTDACVASSALAPLLTTTSKIDAERLAAMVGYVHHRDEARTIYENVRVVRPYESVLISGRDRRVTLTRPPTNKLIDSRDVGDIAAELRRLVLGSLARAVGERRVGVMLSGGLDSSTLLAALAVSRGATSSDLAVTLDFDAPGGDRSHVRALERHFGISVIRLAPRDVTAIRVMRMDAAPSRNIGDAWTLGVAQLAKDQGAEILVTGTGGDQIFGGDLGAAVACGVRRGDFRGAWTAARAQMPYSLTSRSRGRVAVKAMLRPYIPGSVRSARAQRLTRRMPGWAGPVLRRELARYEHERARIQARQGPDARFDEIASNANEATYAEARAQLDSVLPIARAEPIYDEELVRFLTGIPHTMLFAGGAFRGMLRVAMRGLLPESVRCRLDKSDFEPALADTICPFSRYESLLSFAALDALGILRADAFRAYLGPLFGAPRAPSSGSRWLAFWPAVTAEAFLRDS